MNQEWPLTIIATQGYPYSGKTTLADALAMRLKFPTVRFDAILDCVGPPGKPGEANTVKSHAFDILTQAVKTHISLGFSVIVDSPLSHRSHLDNLVALLTQSHDLQIHLVIIECNPKIPYAWEIRFNKRDVSSYNKWYQPREIFKGPEFKRDYTDHDLEVDYPMVSKLVVNTTNYVSYEHVIDAVGDLIQSTTDGARNVDLEMWRRENNSQHHLLQENGEVNKEFCTDGHCVSKYHDRGIKYYATCEVCEQVVTSAKNPRPAYTCSLCPLAIHESCAVAGFSKKFTPKSFPKFLETEAKPAASYCFPEEHPCLRCIVEGKDFSYECEGCIFQCHLKCRLLPTILDHEGQSKGRLFLSFNSISTAYEYKCAACDRLGHHVAYGCIEDCNFNYHPMCVFLPSIKLHQHCGHRHFIKLIYCRKEELEDYICHRCFQEMNPEAWYYYCDICYLEMHLGCAFKEFK